MASQTGDPSSTSTIPPKKSWTEVVKSSTLYSNLEVAVKCLKNEEYESRAKEDTCYNFCETAVYDPDWALQLKFDRKEIEIQASQVNSYKKFKFVKHKNLVPILDILHKNANVSTIICPRLRNLEDFVLSRHEAYYCRKGPINSFSFRYLISSVFEGIVELHSHGVIHGQIQMSNIFVSNGVTRPLYKLGNYALDCSNSYLEQKKRKDYADLGRFILTMMTKIDSVKNSQNKPVFGNPEFNHLAYLLLNAKFKSDQFKFFIYYHPALMTLSDKANFTIQAYEYLCSKNMGPQLDRYVLSNDWFHGMPLGLQNLLIEKNATNVEYDSNNHAFIVGGLSNFFKTLKNCLKHRRTNWKVIRDNKLVNYPDGGGNSKFDSWESITQYFIALQPSSILNLWSFITEYNFYYSSRVPLQELNDPIIMSFHGCQGFCSHSSLKKRPQ